MIVKKPLDKLKSVIYYAAMLKTLNTTITQSPAMPMLDLRRRNLEMRLIPNPEHVKFKTPVGYKDLGWQITTDNNLDYKKCIEMKHDLDEFDNSKYLFKGTERIYICHECKHYFHIDSSD